MQTADRLYKTRLLKGAVPEAAKYLRMICNQGCHTHLYFKDGIPYEQLTGGRHQCPIIEKAWGLVSTYNMIGIDGLRSNIANIESFLVHFHGSINDIKSKLDHFESLNKQRAAKFKAQKQDYYQQQ
jgi:hypothetical protein